MTKKIYRTIVKENMLVYFTASAENVIDYTQIPYTKKLPVLYQQK